MAFAVILEACLDGIRNKIDPPAPVESNIYNLTNRERKRQKIESLPGSLAEAIDIMERSIVVKAALGDHIYNEFLASKYKEWDEFRIDVSKWELDKYLDRY